MDYLRIFDTLWSDYISLVPSALKIFSLFERMNEDVENDHIAIRTFQHPRVSIEVLSKLFIKAGYVERGEYNFEEKKLYAKHFEHKSAKNAPRVFISELRYNEFSSFMQQLVDLMVLNVPQNLINSGELIFARNVFGVPSYEFYELLRKESEYAAWLYAYGFRANHFTVSVNSLTSFKNLESVNELLKNNGYILNNSGGEIKGKPEDLLQQSSIMAEIIPVKFKEGVYRIPSCYYEFALRYPDTNGKLYSGFIAKSADKIFESTNFYS